MIGGYVCSQCWIATYNGQANDSDISFNLALDSNGYIYVTGESKGINTNFDYCTIKYNASGIEEWVRRYNCSTSNGNDVALAITTDCSSNVYVTGLSDSAGSLDIITIKYNQDGDVKWIRRYRGSLEDFASDIVCDAKGNVYITGYSQSGSSFYPITIKYNVNGVQKWAIRETIPGWTVSIDLDNHNNIYIGGYQAIRDSVRYLVVKYDSAGIAQWASGDNILGQGYKLKVNTEGDVFLTGAGGYAFTGNWRWDIVTVKYNTVGQEQWIQRYDGPAQGWDEGHSLILDNQGNVYVTGSSATQQGISPAFDIVTIKYRPSGTEEWVRRYDGFENDDEPYDIDVDDQGNIYVGGYSFGLNNNYWSSDAIIIKYDSSGNQLWVARYNSPSNSAEFLYGIALDRRQGYIYATGWTYSAATNYDFLTIKYPPTGPGIGNSFTHNTKRLALDISPNPAKSVIRVRCPLSTVGGVSQPRLRIFDVSGKLIKEIATPASQSRNDKELVISIKGINPGIYFLQTETEVKKFLVVK
jgi:hypothetical protein